METSSIHCPCGKPTSYLQCCYPLHSGQAFASSAEQLMRSRFSAFYLAAKGELDLCQYLVDTWHSSQYQNPSAALADLKQNMDQQQYYSLRLLDSKSKDDKAEVEFVAFFSAKNSQDKALGKVQQLHERSNFIKEQGRWFYVDGKFCADIKLQRNDNCWCGSAKKFKKCHAE